MASFHLFVTANNAAMNKGAQDLLDSLLFWFGGICPQVALVGITVCLIF